MSEIKHISHLRWSTYKERVGRYTADCSSVLFRLETDQSKEFVERLDSTRAPNRSRQNRVRMQLYLPLENWSATKLQVPV